MLRLLLLDEVMDGIEPGQSDDNEIDRDNDIEKPRHDEDQNAGDERHKRRDMGGGDNHRISCRFCCAAGFCAGMSKTCQNDAARRHYALTRRPPFGSSTPGKIGNRRVCKTLSSFRIAAKRRVRNPYSRIVVMDSGLLADARPRNDEMSPLDLGKIRHGPRCGADFVEQF